MASPTCQVKDGAGAYQATTNGVNVTPANTVTINLVSGAGVTSWQIRCIYADETTTPSSITLTVDSVAKTATFTAPAAGKALIFESKVNGGLGVDGVEDESLTTTFGIFTLTASSKRVVALNQTFEGDATYGWTADLNAIIRLGPGGSPGGSSGDVQYNNAGAFGGISPTGTGRVLRATGASSAAFGPIVNADVDAAAAIAGTKISPDFGAQNITTTGAVRLGATVSATGSVRLPDGGSIVSVSGGLDRPVISHSAGTVVAGDFTNIGQILLRTNAGAGVNLQCNSLNQLVTSANGVQLFSSTTTYGGGVMVLGITNATTVPTTNPTGGGVMYAEGGALKWRGSSGTITTMAPADPHCPTCGRDFAVEHRNDDMGEHLALCLPCLVDALRDSGVDTKKFTITEKRGATKAQWDEAHSASKIHETETTD
jgi:hypothetical protein